MTEVELIQEKQKHIWANEMASLYSQIIVNGIYNSEDFGYQEREEIAAYVSFKNKCVYCFKGHKTDKTLSIELRKLIDDLYSGKKQVDINDNDKLIEQIIYIIGFLNFVNFVLKAYR